MTSPLKFLILIAIALLLTLAALLQLLGLGWSPAGTWAQTISDRKIEATTLEQNPEADRLLQQCIQKLHTSQFQAATQSCQQSATLYRNLDNLKGEADALGNLGIAYFSLGRYPQAIEFYQQSSDIKQKIGDRAGAANTLDNLGNVYLFQGQYQQALEVHQQALSIFQELGDRQGEAHAQINFGNTYSALGQYPQAIEFYQQALNIVETDNGKTRANALTNLANVYSFLRQYPQAIERYQQAIAIEHQIGDRQGEALSLISQGVAYEALHQPQQAVENYRQALTITHDIGDTRGTRGEAAALGNLGNAANRAKQPQQALVFYQQALAISQDMGDRQSQGIALNNIGSTLLYAGQFAQAAENLLNAATLWESLRPGLADANKVSLLETQTFTYRYLQLALVAQNKTALALEASERGRARAFIEQLALRLGSLDLSLTAEAQVTQNLPTLEQIQRIVRAEQATLVEYSLVSATELYIWVVKPTGEITFHSQNLQEALGGMSLANFVIHSRDTLGLQRGAPFVSVRPRDQAETAAQQSRSLQQLYQFLIQPIAADLPSDVKTPVIFIPQGELFSVPFAALQDAAGKALIEQHTILTAPAIEVLEKTRQQAVRTRQTHFQEALVVGNPTMPYLSPHLGELPQQLIPLPASEREAKAIASLLKTQPLMGDQATEEIVGVWQR